MLTLLSECHFWTIRDEVRIKSTDLGAFRYQRNRELQQMQDLASIAKRDYTERRDGIVVPKNSRKTGRLKDNIKKLEEILRSQTIVFSQWKDAAQILLLFSNGIIAHLCIDICTGDILRMVFEKYLVGKLATEVITDAFFTRTHIVLAYNTNQLTVVHFQKPNVRSQGLEKITNMDPRIFHVIIPGTSERKLPRNLSVNSSFDLFVIWTMSSQNEVYPWRPTIRDQDRANIHVFKIKSLQMESIAYCWSENDPLCVDFLRSSETQILTVEQRVSRKGGISAEICTYEINSGKMLRTVLTSISTGTQICSYAFSPDQEKLFLGTVDRNIYLHDLVLQNTKCVTQIDIIPSQCSWHCDSSIIIIANERSQFQCFDLALTPIGNQLQSEDVTPSNLLDLSHYFTVQPALLKIAFSRKPDLANFSQTYAQTECFLLFLFENGPIGCLRFFAGAGMRGDIHNSGLTADVLIDNYLVLNQLEKAVNLLNALNWETYGAMCLISLHKIANYVFFRSDSAKRGQPIELMNRSFKTFADSLSEETKDEFSDQVFDLKRRFFFFLLRKCYFVEAFELAQNIEDYDLFMDLFNLTSSNAELVEFSAAAFSQAAAILYEEDPGTVNLSILNACRSESTCSQSTSSDHALAVQQNKNNAPTNSLKNYVPPLPSFKSKVFNAEMVKINIPKPELRPETNQTERNRPPPPPVPDLRQLKINPPINNSNPSTSSTLAALSLKSSNTINSTQRIPIANGVPSTPAWQIGPDQSVGLPTISSPPTIPYAPSNVLNMLPSASTNITTSNIINQSTQHSTMPFTNYTSPNVLADSILPSNPKMIQPTLNTPIPASLYQPKFYQHPLVSVTIPPSANAIHDEHQKRLLLKKPTASILSNSLSAQNNNSSSTTNTATSSNIGVNGNASSKETNGGKSNVGEKNKVKFSDTVQVAVVPDIPRKEKPPPSKRNGYSRPPSRNFTNPRKELADSLPLCHPNDDYLKDFNPISTDELPNIRTKVSAKSAPSKEEKSGNKSTSNSTPSIKVVHFGVV